MDSIEVEAKTYEEAVRKAVMGLGAEEKDLDIEVTEVDTKGILGLLGSKKIRVVARLRPKLPVEEETAEEFGRKFLADVAGFYGVSLRVESKTVDDRIVFTIESPDEEVFTGHDGEPLEALQHLVNLAIAKHFKQNLKLLLDVNGFRERRKKMIVSMAKRLAETVKRERKPASTKLLNPYERRIVHTLFKNNNRVTTHSEGDGHMKRVIITPSSTGAPAGGRR
ncbi:MAG: RNA-binding cell elongation regulator Jag/EloR [Syntrophorhabdales bacterium]|jgi:spoIIIJ-associated protein